MIGVVAPHERAGPVIGAELLWRCNDLLASLEREDVAFLRPYLQIVQLERRVVLGAPGGEADFVWFPFDCLASLVCTSRDGTLSEAATLGREGVINLFSVIGGCDVAAEAVVQIEGSAGGLSAGVFRQLFDQRPALRRACIGFAGRLVARMSREVLCSSHHAVVPRLAGWLLGASDRTERKVLPLTQEHLAVLLGVQRSTLTEAARTLQAFGAISYRRGLITIQDRQSLEAHACKCYQAGLTILATVHTPFVAWSNGATWLR
ncbi:MAG: Crp/Fnr family transcriptional regulator [Geminicoccaceae bacterium]